MNPPTTPPTTPPMQEDPSRSLERSAWAVLCVLLLAPVIAHGLWRPLVHRLGPAGEAGAVTLAALVVAGTVSGIALLLSRYRRWPSLSAGQARAVAWATSGLSAVAAAALFSLRWPGLLTLLWVAAAVTFLLRWLPVRLPAALDGRARRHPVLCALYVLVTLAVIIKTAQLSTFIGDATRVDQQVLPGEKFVETHSCLTAYVHAAALSRQPVDNLYAAPYWLGSHGFPPAPAGSENPYHPFLLDYFAYPPPFLLAMLPLAPLSGDFAAQRALWFGGNALLLALGLWLIARWLDGAGAHRVLLMAPVLWGTVPVLVTLQVGNFQIAVVMIAILAMLAFDRDRPALGGALLAFAILSKLSPGVLGIVLLAQRRSRCAAWTAGFGIVFVLLSLLTLGVGPLVAFLTYTLPRLSSGATFAFMQEDRFSLLTNLAPFGLPFKLQLAGLDVGDPWLLGRRIGRVYSLVLLGLAIVAARRTGDRRSQAMVWMSLLTLAALQSPFAPGYVTIAFLWAITLRLAEVRSLRAALPWGLLWLLLTLFPPIPNPHLQAAYGVLQSILILAIPAWLLCTAGGRRAEPSCVPSIATSQGA